MELPSGTAPTFTSGVITACTRLKGLNTTSKKFELLIGNEGLSLNNIVKDPASGKQFYVPIKKVVGSQIVKYDPKSKTLRKNTAFLGEDSKRFAGNPKESGGHDLNLSSSAFFSISVVETKEQTIEKENLKSFTLRDYIFRVDAKPNLRENENHAKMLRDKILEQTKGKISKVPRNRRLDVRKNILLMVNPKSGPGKSLKILKDTVVPVLTRADLSYDLIITKRQNHARDLIANEDLSRWSAILILSGDGLLYEVYQGLMMRADWDRVRSIPMGIIAGGSGNGLARALCFEDQRKYVDNGVLGSTLAIAKGRSQPMDLIAVTNLSGKRFYSFLSIGWGFMADCDIESEKIRAVGEIRFTLWAGIRLSNLRSYRGRLSYKPAEIPHLAGTNGSNTRSINSEDVALIGGSAEGDVSRGDSVLEPEEWGPFEEKPAYPSMDSHSLHLPSTLTAPPISEPVPSDWVTVEDDFVMVYGVNAAYIGATLFVAPKARVNDGVIWLLVIKKGISRASLLSALVALEKGEMAEKSGVELFPVTAFRLEPLCKKGFITVDGEPIDYETVQAEVLPSFVRICY